MVPLCFAYYCSGHGYGHATRVSAFACHLLSLDPRPNVYIVSSAPRHVFSDSIARGAQYRYSDIDPVIVQPLAYRVDRQKSVDVLESFLSMKDAKVVDEVAWLKEVQADCVLSDAAFLGCLAANLAGLPSVLITNFSFDSVFSYLSTALFDQTRSRPTLQVPATDSLAPSIIEDLVPDVPISASVLAPLVEQIQAGYRCADLLLLLPGAIPIPSFAAQPNLPSPDWIDPITLTFREDIKEHVRRIMQRPTTKGLLPPVHFPNGIFQSPCCSDDNHDNSPGRMREIYPAPLLVRNPSISPETSPYGATGRSRLLSSLGVPEDRHDPRTTKILIVSFGGQVIKKPHSRTPSRSNSVYKGRNGKLNGMAASMSMSTSISTLNGFSPSSSTSLSAALNSVAARPELSPTQRSSPRRRRISSASHLFIPGAPPAAKPTHLSPATLAVPVFHTTPPTPEQDLAKNPMSPPQSPPQSPPLAGEATFGGENGLEGMKTSLSTLAEAEGIAMEDMPQLVPDSSWIAIVCGVPKEWGKQDGDEDLPEGFYIAPRDVYMPDLTAAADVLLGKLGYGTVSECVDACTPFVYVSRPLFIEEHGLRLYLDKEGVGIELSRADYEAGDWSHAVHDAWLQGRAMKERKREHEAEALRIEQQSKTAEQGGFTAKSGARKRMEEGKKMADGLVRWVDGWWERERMKGAGVSA